MASKIVLVPAMFNQRHSDAAVVPYGSFHGIENLVWLARCDASVAQHGDGPIWRQPADQASPASARNGPFKR